MSLLGRLQGILRPNAAGTIHVHLILKGRIGEGWFDIDEDIPVPPPATLASFVEAVERRGIRLRAAVADSPHLRHTLMLNGERCPIDENLDRSLTEGDQVYLLAPLAGG